MNIGKNIIKKFWNITEKSDKKRIAGQVPPKGIVCCNDLSYITDNNEMHLLDIYYPENTTKKLPVIFDIHGGGWAYGKKEINKHFCMHLAKEGFAVVNLNYRLITEARYPSQLQDIFEALNFLEENCEKYFLDLNNFFIAGDSAGGHLASLTMALQYNDELRKLWNIDTKINIVAGALICGFFDFEPVLKMKNLIVTAYGEMLIGKNFRDSELLPKLSFAGVFNGKMPPLYMISSEQDFIKNQTLSAAEFFDKYNIEYKLKFWQKQKTNKLTHVFNVINPDWEESKQTNKEICDFFKNYVK